MASFLDTLFADFDEKAARRELDQARRQVQSIQELLTAWERWSESDPANGAVQKGTPKAPPSSSKSNNGGRGRASRVVIMQLIRRHGAQAEWTTKDVREGLGLGEEADHGIQISLSRLFRANELERPRKGVYKLPQNRANGEGEESEGLGLLATSPAMGAGQS